MIVKVYLLFVLFVFYNIGLYAQCPTQMDFNTWAQVGGNYAEWNVSSASNLEQKHDGDESIFVSPDSFINVSINGSFLCYDNSDRDWIGFVFGLKKPIGSSKEYDFYLFDWKGDYQNKQGYDCNEGFSLSRVKGDFSGASSTLKYFWGHTNDSIFQVIDSLYGTNQGWMKSVTYNFTLDYTSNRITIIMNSGNKKGGGTFNNDTIFDVPGCYPIGQFGLYHCSQEDIAFFDFSYTIKTDFNLSKDTVCQGDSVDITAFDSLCVDSVGGASASSTINTWQWDFDDGTISNNNINPSHVYTTSGIKNIQLIATDYLGCADTATKPIYVSSLPSAGFVAKDTCENFPINFSDTSSMAYSWQWDFGDGNVDSIQSTNHSYSSLGSYDVSLVVFDSIGLCSDTLIKQIVIDSAITIDLGNDTSQCGGSVLISASNINNANYNWSNGDTTQAITTSSSDTFILSVNRFHCNASDTVIVTIHNPPIADFILDSICEKDSIYPINNSSGSINSWKWDLDNGQSDSVAQPLISFLNGGSYNVSLVVVDSNNCSDTLVQNLTVDSMVSVELGKDTSQCSGTITLDGGTNNNAFYNWSTGDNTQAITVSSSGTIWVNVQRGSCKTSDTIHVSINEIPTADFSFDNICAGEITSFSDLSQGNITSWNWSFGQGDSSSLGNTSFTFDSSGQYIVQLVVETDSGCIDTIQSNLQIVMPGNNVFIGTDTSIFKGENAPVYVSGGTNIQWYPDYNINDIYSHYTFVYPDSSTYYKVTMKDANSCNYSDSVLIKILNRLHVFIPSAFSPNGDGQNDIFTVRGISIENIDIIIYNRWGEIVYEYSGPDFQWDGTLNGENLNQDVFLYNAVISSMHGEKERKAGNLTLVR